MVLSIALAIGIYLLPVKPLKVKEETKDAEEENVISSDSFDVEEYFLESLEATNSSFKDSLTLLESRIDEASDIEKKLEILNKTVNYCYRNKQVSLAVKYEKQKTALSSDAGLLKKTGDQLMRVSFLEKNPAARLFISNSALDAYNKALQANPDDVDIKVRVASVYMDGTNQVMQGVTLLLEVLDQEPNNLDANLILGRYGIVSGQLDKALKRLNTVIDQDSTIAEAYLYRAEALNGLGKTDEAIADFERCKSLLDNPQLENEIDVFIKELKNK